MLYILGSLNDTVKALKIDDVEASVDNIKNNTYKAYRPFTATKDNLSELAQDFIDYILSSDGQEVIEAVGYIVATEEGPYSGSVQKIVVGGSSSVTPVMEKKEAYQKLIPMQILRYRLVILQQVCLVQLKGLLISVSN